jgi:DNA adenine methylase
VLCHEVLQKASIEYREFTDISPEKGDLVYFDPPYHPTDENSFTKYSKSDFTEDDQARLRDFALALHKKGVKVMVSNSNTKFICQLYKHSIFNIQTISAPRLVNCKPEGRKDTEEVIMRNYVD